MVKAALKTGCTSNNTCTVKVLQYIYVISYNVDTSVYVLSTCSGTDTHPYPQSMVWETSHKGAVSFTPHRRPGSPCI